MYTEKAEMALEEVARRHGVSVDDVKKEIAAALKSAEESSLPSARAFWDARPLGGGSPKSGGSGGISRLSGLEARIKPRREP